MQVERGRLDVSVAEQGMRLSAMVRLVIEKVANGHRRGFQVILSLVVRVSDRLFEEASIHPAKKALDASILLYSGCPQVGEIVV